MSRALRLRRALTGFRQDGDNSGHREEQETFIAGAVACRRAPRHQSETNLSMMLGRLLGPRFCPSAAYLPRRKLMVHTR